MSIYKEIKKERERQDEKWGEQNHNILKWNAILTEEIGEIGKAINELFPAKFNPEKFTLPHKNVYISQLREELIQAAAVCVAWLECIERRCGELD